MNQSLAQVAKAYVELVKKGYFTSTVGGTERYFGGLVIGSIPSNVESILEIGSATGLLMEMVLRARTSIRAVTIVECSAAAEACRDRIAPLLKAREGQFDVVQ